jgi:hypothetical protein
MTRGERIVGVALVLITAAGLVASAAIHVAAGRSIGVAKYFHVLATAEIPIVFGVQPAVYFLPGTIVAIALILLLQPFGPALILDVIPQAVFLAMACGQVWLLYRLVLSLVRRLRRP